jgi:hypothetical protein
MMRQSNTMMPFFNWMWIQSFMFIHEGVNKGKKYGRENKCYQKKS